MKPNLTLGAVVLALAFAGLALGQGAASGRPKLALGQAEFHLGLAKTNETLTHTFLLKNEGTADLRVENVAPC